MICKIKYEKDGNEIIPYGLRLIPDFGYWANWKKEDVIHR